MADDIETGEEKKGVGIVGAGVALGAGVGTAAAGATIAHGSAIKKMAEGDEALLKFAKDTKGGLRKSAQDADNAFTTMFKDAEAFKADEVAFGDAVERMKGLNKDAAKAVSTEAKDVYKAAQQFYATDAVKEAAKAAGANAQKLEGAGLEALNNAVKVERAGAMARPIKAFSNMSTGGKIGLGAAVAVATIGTGLLVAKFRNSGSKVDQLQAERASAAEQGAAPAR